MSIGRKVSLITGAGRGIGAAIARSFAKQGHSVVIGDVDVASVRSCAESIGPGALGVGLDVRDRSSVEQAIALIVERYGGLDVLVNNAGVLCTGPFDAVSPTDWQALVSVNLTGLFHCIQSAAPAMKRRRNASIINIASISAERGGGVFGNVWYAATKAAVIAITKGLARELGPYGIRVNAISPGVVDTQMIREFLTPEARQSVLSRIPMQRFVSTEDIAQAAVFLSAEGASAITGEVLTVDAGLLWS